MSRGGAGPRDVLVAGAGPAGSVAARELARRGASVLLIDKSVFPRPKVCGCCINPRALDALRRAGLDGLTERLGAVPLTSLELGCGGRRAVVRESLGVALSRDALDMALIDAAREAGAEFLSETAAALLPPDDSGLPGLSLTRGKNSEAEHGRFIVSAVGLTDSLRKDGVGPEVASRSRIGAGAIAPEAPASYVPGRIFMACAREGYIGLVVLEDGRLDIAAALRPGAVREAGGIGPLAERIVAEAGFPEVPGLAALPWKGTAPLTRTARSLAEGGVFRVGDAAGYVEPFTGEGIAWALSGGLALAGLLSEALAGARPTAGRDWPLIHRREIARRQLVCRATSATLKTPWLTGLLARVLPACPGLVRPVIRSIHRVRPSPVGGFRPR